MPKYSPKISLIIRSTKNPVFFSVSALFTAYLLGLQSLHFPTIIPQIQTFTKCRKNTPKKQAFHYVTGQIILSSSGHFLLSSSSYQSIDLPIIIIAFCVLEGGHFPNFFSSFPSFSKSFIHLLFSPFLILSRLKR